MQKSHCPLPPGSEAVRCRRSTAHCPRPWRSVSQEYHCPLAQAGRQCIAGDARPTAPREGGSERREYHSPLPSGSAAVRSTISTAHSPQAAWQCVTLPTAPCPQQQCSRAHTVQCGAEHQAVRHHTEATGGAARHAGCSGQMRPCVTARRRRQGSVGQVRECTGPAMPQHTYTQRAHNTHSPARLPVPVGRHPGLCLLVTAPSAHHTTPHHTTPHHTTPHHTTPHYTPPHLAPGKVPGPLPASPYGPAGVVAGPCCDPRSGTLQAPAGPHYRTGLNLPLDWFTSDQQRHLVAHHMRTLPTMTVLAERLAHRNVWCGVVGWGGVWGGVGWWGGVVWGGGGVGCGVGWDGVWGVGCGVWRIWIWIWSWGRSQGSQDPQGVA